MNPKGVPHINTISVGHDSIQEKDTVAGYLCSGRPEAVCISCTPHLIYKGLRLAFSVKPNRSASYTERMAEGIVSERSGGDVSDENEHNAPVLFE